MRYFFGRIIKVIAARKIQQAIARIATGGNLFL
jgi:hypothetical protein